eukprot:scaffold118782_cov39-Prasinocladus_malaysianus.AAC.1
MANYGEKAMSETYQLRIETAMIMQVSRHSDGRHCDRVCDAALFLGDAVSWLSSGTLVVRVQVSLICTNTNARIRFECTGTATLVGQRRAATCNLSRYLRVSNSSVMAPLWVIGIPYK